MALVALPPELRSICRRLTSTKAEQLPSLLPIFLKDVLRCQEPLSRPQDAKGSETTSEAAVLVHKLKTQISTLLNGRSIQGHFVGVALAKAVVEAGGWECLRTSEPWVRGLLSVLQRKDPAVSKDLAIVTITKMFTLMHAFPTLVREIVTPNLPSFATACLQILKPPVSSKAMKTPYSLIETIFEAMSALIPLFPTTLRQFTAKFKADARAFLAPTSSDGALIPASLQESSRRLSVRLHMTAAKGGDSTEWTKHIEGLTKTFHSTADQVFRAVEESWESTSGYVSQSVNFDTEPQGGSDNAEQLPSWVGVQAGSERMIGLLNFIADYLRCRTKVTVTIPISAIVDVTMRISSIMPPKHEKAKFQSIQMNAAVGREERDELWTVFPDIQIAAMRLLLALVQRLERNYIPVAQEALDQILRLFGSSYRLPEARAMTFLLTKEILCLCGPTLAKATVEGLSLVIKSCCRDLLGASGHLKRPKQQATTLQNGSKSKYITQNTDAFLSTKAEDELVSVSLGADHLSAAEALLTILFSHVPQHYLPSALRSRMLKMAILSQNRDAQVASVLHPSRDKSGRTPQVILPYLTQQFPRDQSVEVLRFNFRPLATGTRSEFMDVNDDMVLEDEDDENQGSRPATNGFLFGQPMEESSFHNAPTTLTALEPPKAAIPVAAQTAAPIQMPFLPRSSEVTIRSEEETVVQPPPTNSLKRKSQDATTEDAVVSKRVEIDTTMTTTLLDDVPTALRATNQTEVVGTGQGEEDDSDDESVHLNMELDSDDDDDNDDEEEDGE